MSPSPLMILFNFTLLKKPLIEEYSVAAQIYKLSSADMCEIAKNSVLQSGFEACVKRQWLGPNFHTEGPTENDCTKTNVPLRRAVYRQTILQREKAIVRGGNEVPDELIRFTPIPANEHTILKEIEEGITVPEKLCPE